MTRIQGIEVFGRVVKVRAVVLVKKTGKLKN
jgi:hypothetical protein